MALKKEQLSLKKWSNQKWRTSDGSESKGKKRYLPDSAWNALSPGEKAATNRTKSKGNEKGKQFVAQPESIASKTAPYRNESVEVGDMNEIDLNEKYVLVESKASDIKGTGRVAQLAKEYLAKYPTKFTFRANKHVETLEKYLGNRAKEVIRVVIGGHFVPTHEGNQWSGTCAVAFTNDKIFVAQKGLLFGTENVKTINRDKIDDVQISRGVIYGMFTVHARSEYLVIGVLHKDALQELQQFLEKYADAKLKIKPSQEPDQLSKQVVNESLAEALFNNLSEDFFAVEVEKAPGEVHSDTIEADTEDEAITKAIEMFGVDVENIRHLQRINEAEGDDEKPKKKSEVDDLMDDTEDGMMERIRKWREENDAEWVEVADKPEKPHSDRAVPIEEIERGEAIKAEEAAYEQQMLAGIKGNTPYIDDYASNTPDLYFRDPKTGQMFKKQRPVDPKTGKMMGLPDYMKQPGWNEPDPEPAKDSVTGKPLVGKDGKPLLNSAPISDEMYVLTEKLTKPHKGEEKQEFISRFMGDKLSKKEFKDNKQRVAVAYSQWNRGKLRESESVNELDNSTVKNAVHKRMLNVIKGSDEEFASNFSKYIDTKMTADKLGYDTTAEDVDDKVLSEAKRHPLLVKYGVEGFNKPKRTPSHKTKSHLVVAKKGGKVKVVRFGAQGAKGSPKKEGESEAYRKRRQGFVARHKAQNPGGMKDKFSALYWANKVKW
jgi:hypothetical protein